MLRYAVVIKRLAAEHQPGVVQPGRTGLHPRMIVIFRRIMAQHAPFVTEAGKGHIRLMAGMARGSDRIHGINLGMTILDTHRAQQIFGLQRVQVQRIGLQREQINHRRAVQAQIFLRQRIFVRPRFLQHDINFKPRQNLREIHIFQAAQRHRHKFFPEGKILQQ